MTQPPDPSAPAPNPYGPSYPQTPGPPPPPYGQPPLGGGERPPGKGMAIAALVLAVVGCLVLTALISAGLAIAVLVKGKDGRNHGKGLAIGALVIDALWIALTVLVVVLAATGALDYRDDSGAVDRAETIDIDDLRVGDCLDNKVVAGIIGGDAGDTGDGERPTVTRVKVVPCDDPHDAEYFSKVDASDLGDDFPGDPAVAALANTDCTSALIAFLGSDTNEDGLVFTFISPDKDSWERDHRDVQCLVGDPAGRTSGTLEQSGA